MALHRHHPVQQDPLHCRTLRLGAQRGSLECRAAAVGATAFPRAALNVCLQVALVPEPTKGGVSPDALAGAGRAAVAELPRVQLRGLMCVPPPQPSPTAARAVFARLRVALQDLNAGGLKLDTLSMGMSADFESAIAEGATLVRIGTALFGSR